MKGSQGNRFPVSRHWAKRCHASAKRGRKLLHATEPQGPRRVAVRCDLDHTSAADGLASFARPPGADVDATREITGVVAAQVEPNAVTGGVHEVATARSGERPLTPGQARRLERPQRRYQRE